MNDVGLMPRAKARPSAQMLLSFARSRAYERLERGIGFPILVVAAPAGFGKSTVLREFLGAAGRPYRYLPLVAGQGDLLSFLRALAACLSDVVPALAIAFASVYERAHQTENVVQDIAAWAAGHLAPVQLTLMVDELENITDERLYRLLPELVDRTAHTGIRWILVAETAARFPVARWLAEDRMDLLEESDLAITEDDLTAAADRTDAAVSRPIMHALVRATSNWPATLALALNARDALPVLGRDGTAHSYASFATRAFAALSQREQRFLRETCVYKHFDFGLLSAAGWRNAEPMLARLCAAGAFLFRDAAGVYRYHAVFGAFLEDQLRAGPAQTERRIRTAAAEICRQTGRWVDALEFYCGLQTARPLAELLSEHGFALVDRGEAALVYRSLAVLNDAEFEHFPVALAVKASLESLHGSFDVAEAWFRHALTNAVDPRERGAIVFRFATDLVRQDRRDAVDVLEPVVAEGGHDRALAVSLAGLLATAYATRGLQAPAAQTIERALVQSMDVDDPAIRAKLYFQAGYVAFFARDPVRAKGFAQQAVEAALASHLYDIAARALSILYNIAIDYEDDVRAGQEYLEQLVSCSIKAGSRHLLVYAKLGQFEIEVLRGNLHESARLDAALKVLEVDYSVLASETLLPAQALRAAWAGDFHRAYALLATTAELQITPVRVSQRHAEIALYAAAAGLRLEAEAAVRSALDTVVKNEPADRSAVLTNAYIALALVLLGRHRHAAQLVSELRRSSALTARVAVFVRAIRTINERWRSGRYATDLRETLLELDAVDFGGIGRLIEALPLPQTFRTPLLQLSVPERDVLAHLSAGRTATQIAALCGRSVQSIEALVGSLCRKLGCATARHAVALAGSTGPTDPGVGNAG